MNDWTTASPTIGPALATCVNKTMCWCQWREDVSDVVDTSKHGQRPDLNVDLEGWAGPVGEQNDATVVASRAAVQ